MKLFTWMHRKSKTDITGSFNGSATGLKSSVENQGVHVPLSTKSTNSTLKWQAQDRNHFKEVSAENYEVLKIGEDDEIFPGFLTIGTLSMEPVTEPSTPTFGFASQETNEEEIADIKYELNLISENLEKFLQAEMEGKNELPSNKTRASNITLNDETKEDVCIYKSFKTELYPLQEFLLGSSTDQCDKEEMEQKGKTILHGLFKKSGVVKKSCFTDHSSNHLTNTMQQKPPTCPGVSVTSTGCVATPLLTVPKLKKIKSMFRNKIHPEISKEAEEPNGFTSHNDNAKKQNKSKSVIRMINKIGSWTSLTNGKNHRSKTDLILPPDAIAPTNLDLPTKQIVSYAGREHWIKTDEEYFVLEL